MQEGNVFGEWVVKKPLSAGGQGETFIVFRKSDGSRKAYVLKRFKNRGTLERNQREVAAVRKLDHVNIVKWIDADLESAAPFMVTEYYGGGPLSNLEVETWSILERLRLFRGICTGVAEAHNKKIVHRDLKPENIFLREDRRTPVVGDFGICFIDEHGERITLTEEVVGARHFTAPELEDRRLDKVTAAADVYSLGKLLYWLQKRKIFAREKHREEDWDLTNCDTEHSRDRERYALVYEVIDRCLRARPEDRFANATKLLREVDKLIARIERHAHALDFHAVHLCNFCGVGEYERVADTRRASSDVEATNLATFGVPSQMQGTAWHVLWCNYCGHVEHFCEPRAQSRYPKDPWRNRVESE